MRELATSPRSGRLTAVSLPKYEGSWRSPSGILREGSGGTGSWTGKVTVSPDSYTMRKASFNVQRRSRLKLTGLVSPSPVGLAMVNEQKPSPP